MSKVVNWLSAERTANGARQLLEEIRKHQKDMPLEAQNDMTFGALVVLYEMGQARGMKLTGINKLLAIYAGLFVILFLSIWALHGDVPWLTTLFGHLFGL